MGLARDLRNRRGTSIRKISVSEWADEDGQPFELYCRPITCYDLNELQRKHPTVLQAPTIASMVDLIVMKAEGQDGEKLFNTGEDKMDLMGEETIVISEIANQMFGTIESIEDLAKN